MIQKEISKIKFKDLFNKLFIESKINISIKTYFVNGLFFKIIPENKIRTLR